MNQKIINKTTRLQITQKKNSEQLINKHVLMIGNKIIYFITTTNLGHARLPSICSSITTSQFNVNLNTFRYSINKIKQKKNNY